MTNSDTRQGIIRSMSHCKLLKFRCLLMSLLLFVFSLPAAGEFETTKKAAEQGDSEAQYSLGGMYIQGEEVPKDYAKAAYWFHQAAEQEFIKAQTMLGLMYDRGEGVPEDNAEATRWYRLAAEQGYAQAQYNLGFMYAQSDGVPEDKAETARWYQMAAEQGHAEA